MPAEIIKLEQKYSGWCELYVARIRTPEGGIIKREVEDHGRAVCVLPYDPTHKRALVIRQLRAPVLYEGQQADIIEAIAGGIDGEENAEAGIRREAMEEAGLRLNEVEHITCAWTMPGISTERMDFFIGRYTPADRIGTGGGIEGEQIEIVE